MASPEGSNWVFDCPLMDDLAAADFAATPAGAFYWTSPMQPQMHTQVQGVSAAPAPNPCAEINSSVSVDWDHAKEQPTINVLGQKLVLNRAPKHAGRK